MDLSTKEREIMADFVWSNNAHKQKTAAIHAVVIKYSAKLTEKDVSALCGLLRIPVSFAGVIKCALLTADKLRELSKDNDGD